METAIQIGTILLEIFTAYLLKNKILDLISRVLQGIIAPLDFLIHRLEKTYTSIVRLNFRQRVYNVILVSISFVMLVSEFGTLREILNTTATSDMIGILGVQLRVGTFAAIAYITIAVILGFMSLELFDVRSFFQGVFFNDPPRHETVEPGKAGVTDNLDRSKAKTWIATSFFAVLLLLAILQGILAIQRFQLSRKDETVQNLVGGFALPLFYFILGFLTPIMAAFALLSFDVFGALVAKFLVGVIQFLQKVIAAVFMAIEVIIQVISSPIEKLLEFFGIYQERNINERNKDAVTPAVRLAPLENNSPVYLENLASIYRLFASSRKRDSTLMFLSDVYDMNFLVPSHDFKISVNTIFDEVSDYMKQRFLMFQGRSIQFQYINSEGTLCNIPLSDKIIDYTKLTDTIIIDAFYEPEGSS